MSDANEKFGGAIPVIKYFNIKGRAEPIRLLLEELGVKYEDVRIAREEWPELKQKLTESGENYFEQVPIFIVNEQVYVQSFAIYHYIANLFDLYGSNAEEKYKIDVIAEGYLDWVRDATAIFSGTEEAKQLFWKEKSPAILGRIDKVLAKFKADPYVLGEKLSWVDALMFYLVGRCKPEMPDVAEKYHHLGAIYTAFGSRPNIAAYLASDRVPK